MQLELLCPKGVERDCDETVHCRQPWTNQTASYCVCGCCSGFSAVAAIAGTEADVPVPSYAASASLGSTFDIVVRYGGDPAYQGAFDAAAARWEQIITADIADVTSSTYGFIDDLLIDASVVAIDGAGQILGQAGPDEFRSGSSLPDHGIMRFDSADVAQMAANGTLAAVIMHEMGHVLGIGTIWSSLGLRSGYSYTGAHALAEYRALTGNPAATSVPLE